MVKKQLPMTDREMDGQEMDNSVRNSVGGARVEEKACFDVESTVLRYSKVRNCCDDVRSCCARDSWLH